MISRSEAALHVGVLGTGQWCPVHLKALSESPHVTRVSLVGRNREALSSLAAKFPVVTQTFSDHRALADDESVDVVNIVLPHHMHAPRAIEALSSGKHVICEKPAATSLEDFDRMVEAAETHAVRLMVVMNQLYNPITWRMRELVDSGRMGRPFLSVENSFSRAVKNYRNPHAWRTNRHEAGGGALIDGGYHMVYRHLYTLAAQGAPAWVVADASQLGVSADPQPVESKGEDFVSATVGYTGALRIEWAHGWTLGADIERARQSFVTGTDGTLELTDRPDDPILFHRPGGEARAGSGSIEVEPGPRTGEETTHACLLDYLDCLATGRQPERASLALARSTLAMVLAVYESSRLGRRVALS